MDDVTENFASAGVEVGPAAEAASTFVVDLDGIAHIIDPTHKAIPQSTRCYRSIWRAWTVDANPPLVCGRCVKALLI